MLSARLLGFAAVLSLSSIGGPADAGNLMYARGDFAVEVDFDTLTITPVGDNCLLEVAGILELTGTVVGRAEGVTRALVLSSCDEVAASPPGTFEDRFKSDLQFAGVVGEDQEPVVADLVYRGTTHAGGDIEARFRFSNGLTGFVQVEAVLGIGGVYRGFVALPH